MSEAHLVKNPLDPKVILKPNPEGKNSDCSNVSICFIGSLQYLSTAIDQQHCGRESQRRTHQKIRRRHRRRIVYRGHHEWKMTARDFDALNILSQLYIYHQKHSMTGLRDLRLALSLETMILD